jgi:hypothetical protein
VVNRPCNSTWMHQFTLNTLSYVSHLKHVAWNGQCATSELIWVRVKCLSLFVDNCVLFIIYWKATCKTLGNNFTNKNLHLPSVQAEYKSLMHTLTILLSVVWLSLMLYD